MYDVFCISAGQLSVKKDANIINKQNLYLNYGLLSLTTIIEEIGLNPIQLQGRFSNPEKFAEYCVNLGIANTKYPVFISIPSFYAITWVNSFTKVLKEQYKIRKIAVGGRWVIDGEINQLKALLSYVDIIIDGLGENKIPDILDKKNVKFDGYIPLNYELLDQRTLYQPSLEVSRGCGMKCDFCQERNEKLQPLKDALDVVQEAKNTLIFDNLNPMSLYFEASMFKPTAQWLESLIEQREILEQSFLWRAESRVDTLPDKLIPLLSKSGMKVLDLGLESASPEQLKKMGKSQSPIKYLQRASKLLHIASDFGIQVKVNVMLYAGETDNTINETYKWLDAHRDFIKGVSVGPVVAFGWDNKKSGFIKSLESSGASIHHSSFTGVTNFNLSDSISYEKSLVKSKEISREFMTAKDYYCLKSFSYFSRDYSYQDFVNDIKREKGNYAFDISEL